MSSLNEYSKKLKDLRKEINKEAKKLILISAKELFEKHERIKACGWAQYIPAFNDGDPCVFSLTEFEVAIGFTNEDFEKYFSHLSKNDDYLEGEQDYNSEAGFLYIKNAIWFNVYEMSHEHLKHYFDDQMINDLKDFMSGVYDIQSELESIFGSNARILITREGLTVEDYDCGF